MPDLKTLALALCLGLCAAGAEAACNGRDLLADLSGADRAALDAAVAAQPYTSGNHWRATRGASRVDVIGTFHLYDPRMDAIAARLAPVIAGADRVLLEATGDEIARLKAEIARRPELIVITTGPTLPEQLTRPEWARLSAEMTARGIPAFMASKLRPWYVTIMLGVPPCAMASLDDAQGLDHILTAQAEAAGVPVGALEPFDTVFRIFDGMSAGDQIDMVRASLPLAAGAEDMFATLVASYFGQEHRLIWELSRQAALRAPGIPPGQAEADFAKLERALLTGRNRAWMDVILPAAEGRRIVVAVGAAHLSGNEGVLNLLAQAGYSLERQDF